MLRDLVADARYAVRTLARRPGFAFTAVATLGLGIGANTAVFSVVNGIMLRPLPYAEPDELVAVWPARFISHQEVELFDERMVSLAGVAGVAPSWNATLTGGGAPAQLVGSRTTGNLFGVIGVHPALGRTIVPEDAQPGAEPVVVLSHALWRGRFGQDSSLIGRRITLDGTAQTVIGVMPPDFELLRDDTEVWQPLVADPQAWYHRGGVLFAIARLAEGSSAGQAQWELRQLAANLEGELGLPDEYGQDADVVPLKARLVGNVRTTLLVILGAVGFLLLIVGANLGNLLLARASGRQSEMAIRSALGAGRGRLVTQLLTESVVLAIAGGLVGLLLAVWGVRLIAGSLPGDTPRVAGIMLDANVLAVCALLAMGSGIVFGLAPAWLTARAELPSVLRGAGRAGGRGNSRGQRARGAFVIAEVALAFTLVVGAGLMLRTVWNLVSVDAGFESRNVLTLQVQPTGAAFASGTQRGECYREILKRIDALPGVVAVGAIQHLPLGGGSWGASVDVEGFELPAGAAQPVVGWRVVGAEYFRAMRIRLVSGRPFERSDGPSVPPVVLVNESLARRFWPGEDPLGKRIRARNATGGEWAEVVGVVADVRHMSLDYEPVPELYRPLTQDPRGSMTLVVRTQSSPETIIGAVQEAVWAVHPDIPISRVRTLEQVVYESVARPRLIMTLLGAFACAGLLLGAVGVYGVMALGVAQRRREIGIRIALGAEPARVVGSVVAGGVRLALIGAAIGVAAAMLLTRAMQSLVFGVGVTDPLTLAGTALVVLLTAGAASFVPARQAARLDPIMVLREE